MKKIKLFISILFISVTFSSCDMDTVMDTLGKGMSLYERYKDANRGVKLRQTKLKNVEFNSTRSSISPFLQGVKDLNYITFPDVNSKFRNEIFTKLKAEVGKDKLTEYNCSENQCVYSYKDKALVIAKQNGNNLDAMTIKGNFTPRMIENAIKSGDIFKIKDYLK